MTAPAPRRPADRPVERRLLGAPLPVDELLRLAAVVDYDLLDTPPEPEYDALVDLAASVCGTPVAALSVVDIGRQYFKGIVGVDVRETRREVSFCAWALLEPQQTFVVPDASVDPRFAENDLVTGPLNVRAYAGVPLLASDDQPIGALCVIDVVPRQFTSEELTGLRTLAGAAQAQLELRRLVRGR